MSTKTNHLFNGTSTWKVLTYFLHHPSSIVYVNELANLLKIGSASANSALHELENMGLLEMRERARSHFYSINNEMAVVKSLKVAHFIARLEDLGFVDKFLEVDKDIVSLAIYGSFADGSFKEKSDLNILIISHKEAPAFSPVALELEKGLGLHINLEICTLSKWSCLKKKENGFYQEVTASHVLLCGNQV